MDIDLDYRFPEIVEGTPPGFRFMTNIRPEGEMRPSWAQEWQSADEFLEETIGRLGADNVVVTEPAYDAYGTPIRGRAVHVRVGVTPSE